MRKQLLIVFIVFLITSCQAFAQNKINSFIYQLQDVRHETLINTSFNIGIVDIDDANFSTIELQDLENQDKKIVSYLSIGEAENYRDYWEEGDFDNNPPGFLDEQNPDFPDNYKVKFWENEWQEIVLKRVDEIINAGYDGVYLDIIDAYFFFQEKGRTTARSEMEDFVKRIAKRGKNKNPDFLIIPQNSPELVVDSNYLNTIDGIGKEDTFFYDDKKIKLKTIKRDLRFLKMITDSGRFVLAIDYPTDIKKQCKFIKLAKRNSLTPFISNRDLNKIDFPVCQE